MIDKARYFMLRRNTGILTQDQMDEMAEYEASIPMTTKPTGDYQKEYAKKLRTIPSEENFVVKYEILLEKFLKRFEEIEGVKFNEDYLDNIKVVLYYFAKDEAFFECKNLSTLSKPSFKKGLLIVGSYGNGKTSTMKVLRALFEHTPISFKAFTANRIVTRFEETNDNRERHGFMTTTKTGRAYFDDVKTEKEASNYGKHNLMKDIIEERYNQKLKTYITCNYVDEDDAENLVDALQEFHVKYGPRVYDRIFQMFNIIEFKGKSLRK